MGDLDDIESQLFSNYTTLLTEKMLKANEAHKAWDIAVVTVTGYSEKSASWWQKWAGDKLQANFDLELVTLSSEFPPTSAEVAYELNQVDPDNLEFDLYESGTIQ